MAAIPKKKLCWNCEGRVPQNEENCSFCGVYLNGTLDIKKRRRDDEEDIHDQDAAPSLVKPLHQPPYTPEGNTENAPIEAKKTESFLEKFRLGPLKKDFLSLLMLVVGSIFFLFSFILLFFSHEGHLTLQWNGSYWFIYMIVSVPLLVLGWRFLDQIHDNDQEPKSE
jgi:hypothetical protein